MSRQFTISWLQIIERIAQFENVSIRKRSLVLPSYQPLSVPGRFKEKKQRRRNRVRVEAGDAETVKRHGSLLSHCMNDHGDEI